MTPELRRLVVHAFFRRLAASKRPILIGPWRSELGFEGLYWLPFLRWAAQRYALNPSRFVVVSRGGAGILYGTKAIDLFRLRSVDAVRLENAYDWQATKLQKQTRLTAWDKDVLRDAASQVLGKGARYHILHPSWMYWALAPYWEEQRGLPYLSSMTDFALIGKMPRPKIADLPPQYVAMKWYHRATFPGGDAAVQQAVATITSIVGAQTKIIQLSGAPGVDDHADLQVEHPSVMNLPPVPPDQNLAQQIQVLAHATAFVGTYGGLAQLALRLGVPSCSFYKEFGGTAHAHLTLSSVLSQRTKVPFVVGSLDDLQLWRQVVSVPGQVQELVPA